MLALVGRSARGSDRIIKTLIHCGATVDVVNIRNNTAMHFIAEHKHRIIAVEVNLCRILLSPPCKVDRQITIAPTRNAAWG